MSRWTEFLNQEQKAAVLHDQGPLLILAGAGSGKTTVLVSRTGRLIDEVKVSPERICVLTFTNKAARELKGRVSQKVGRGARKVWSGTFHGFGLQFLKEFWRDAELPQKFGVIDGSDVMGILKDLLKSYNALEKERFSTERLMEKISILRQTGSEEFLDDTIESAMSVVLAPKLVKKMKHLGVVDFEDLLLRPLQIIRSNPRIREKMQHRFDHIMVDEFQDTNMVQMKLVDVLSAGHKNIAVVGDDDQSIYGWRGAEVKNILDFPKRYQGCRVIRLEQNYRSAAKILNLANSIIENNKNRHGKILRPALDKEGELPELFVYENEEVEVEQVIYELEQFYKKGFQWKDIAILYRSNSQGGLLEGRLRNAQIPYKLTGGTALFDRKEVKDVLAFIRSAVSPTEVSFRRIINMPARGIGEKTLEDIELTGEALKHQTLMNVEEGSYENRRDLPFIKKAVRWATENSGEKASREIFNLMSFLESFKTELVVSQESAESVLNQQLEQVGYKDYVFQSYRDPKVAEKRWWGVQILGRILDGMFSKKGRTLFTLEKFIESMELRDPVDDDGGKANEVQLMTLHACKGLEFPLVFLIGVEEDLLPHAKLGMDIDEERRLFYVGVTRAQKHLILTRCQQRKRYGKMQDIAPSRFLLEVDKGLYVEHEEFRPVTEAERKDLVANFLKGLDKKIANRQQQES